MNSITTLNTVNTFSKIPIESTRELAKAKTRRALLRSALQLYNAEGQYGMSMNKVAKGAGIAQPSFYNHFESLDTLQNELSSQLKADYLSPMRLAWVTMLKDYNLLIKEQFNQRCQYCLTMIFDAAFQNIALFQRLIEDSLRFYSEIDNKTDNKGLGSLITEIKNEWTKIFIEGLEASGCSFELSDINLCVDIASAQVHELILGCHQNRYSRAQAIALLSKNFDGLFGGFFTKGLQDIES